MRTGTEHDAFRHEALLYSGQGQFLDGTLGFIGDGLSNGEPTLVIVSARKIEALRSRLGGAAGRVHFADMAEVGRNPARIIPAWRRFLDDHGHAGGRVRGIGEPIVLGRSPAEIAECQRHEALLNVAFDGSGPWWLLCPYDTGTLPAEVIQEAERTHPFVARHGHHERSATCPGTETLAAPFDAPLPDPPAEMNELTFAEDDFAPLRRLVSEHAVRAGLDESQTAELVLAVHELAANSIRHGGGRGTLRVWQQDDGLVCEVADRGHIVDPLVGREHPPIDRTDGRGLWLVNQLCDLVQLRSFADGTVVRVHAGPRRAPAPPR